MSMDSPFPFHSSSSSSKRPCPSSSLENPNNSDRVKNVLLSFLSLSDLPSLSLHNSFDNLLPQSPDDADNTDADAIINRAITVGTMLIRAAEYSSRKRASNHNSLSWPLPPDLTIKVFSMLDTQSLCYASATCSLFSKCTKDPMCYANLDLTTLVPKVNNAVVATMIQRAGNALRSLKLGVVPGASALPGSYQPFIYSMRNADVEVSNFSWNDKRSRQGRESSILTRCCLSPLSGDGGAPGALLRKLHLYNIERMDNASLGAALSMCPSLIDLEIVGLHVELRTTLISVSACCHLIERLCFESSTPGRDDSLKMQTCTQLVDNCPNITSLSLRGFKLHDYKVRTLIKGFQKLKYVDFSTSYSIIGSFLRTLGCSTGGGGNLLEVLILRDCMHLKKIEVVRLLTAIIQGDFKLLVHLDISSKEGLASEDDWYNSCFNYSVLPVQQVLEARPNLHLVAEYPSAGGSHMSDGSSFCLSTSESSYSSDHGSGSEDGEDASYFVYEESSDEVEFLAP